MWPFPLLFICILMLGAPATASDFGDRLARAALERTHHTVRYDGRYQRIAYPDGDVDARRGVCTDVVIRSYRQLGIDLQKQVHEDMLVNFDAYPSFWGLKRPDSNIDHRRVPNLQTFFARQGAQIHDKKRGVGYQRGDVLMWMLSGNLPHTGIVVRIADATGPTQIVHNIGAGPERSEISPQWRLTGHYRYTGKHQTP